MITRVIVLVIDGLGVGAMPDAAEYGDAGSNTLSHLAEAVGGLTLPRWKGSGLAISRRSKVCGRWGSRKGVSVVLDFSRRVWIPWPAIGKWPAI